MRQILILILIISVFTFVKPTMAKDTDVSSDEEISTDEDIEAHLQDRNKHKKKKKGERNVKVQPSQEDDENIILELDEN